MKLLDFPIIKFTLCLILGICIAHFKTFELNAVLLVTSAFLTVITVHWFLLRRKPNKSLYFGILSYAFVILLGVLTYTLNNDTLKPNHYSNAVNSNSENQSTTFKIRERLKPDVYNDKYIVSVESFGNKKAIGKLLINIKNDSLTKRYNVDDILLTSAKLQDIQKPLNPHQFDYRTYLKLKQVYHQLYLTENEVLQISNSTHTVYGFADQLRLKINSKLESAGFDSDVLSIINALLLGQKQTIDKTIYNNYVNSGTIHILAVSGLHVGIIYLILDFILLHFVRLRNGHFLKPLIIILVLWCFAILAGLSPSVTRAVTMFSAISFARLFSRSDNIYNTLAISAFIILLLKPSFLFEVGFQMSYLAVLGIVSIQPKLYKIWKPKYRITDKFWQILTVTLAAQIGVAPISLYYFHQFPGLFFISNLVVIPFLGIILSLGILVIILGLLNALPEFIVVAYSIVIKGLNGFIAWIATFEEFLFKDIPFSLLQVIVVYLIVIAFMQAYKTKSYRWVTVSLFAILAFQLTLFYHSYSKNTSKFVIFNKSRYSIIGEKYGNGLRVYHNLDSVKFKSENSIKNYKIGERISEVKAEPLHSFYKFKHNRILVIDSLGVYNAVSFQPDYILLRNSPKINLNRMLDSLTPKTIIADASNYKSYIKRWKATCEHKKIPFHQTSEKGAFILE